MLVGTTVDKDKAKTEVQVGIGHSVFLVNKKRSTVDRACRGRGESIELLPRIS